MATQRICFRAVTRALLCKTQSLPTATCQPQCLYRALRHPRHFSTSQPQRSSAKPKIYTADAYPNLQRDSRFAALTQDHVNHFKTILDDSPSALIDGLSQDAADDLEPYNTDWMGKYRGKSRLVLKPSSTEQVSQILQYCNEQRLPVVPQGGNSGLVGGSVPVFDEIVLSLSRMNSIRSFDETSGILVADAGVVLEIADNYLAERRHIYPLDLGAKGSCQLGGTVATNAGGLRLLRYGSYHGNILGLEVVLPDGTVVDDLGTLRKNNTGYDLKQLFIGGEGSIGVITGVSVLCPQRGAAVNVAAFGMHSFEACQTAFREAKARLSEIISAFEFMDRASQAGLKTAKDVALPLDADYPFYCLVETSGSNAEHDQDKLEAFLEHVMEQEIVADGVVAQDQTQAQNLWYCREGIVEAMNHWGGVYKYDLSVPIPRMYELVEETRARLASAGLLGKGLAGLEQDGDRFPVVDVVAFGHLGDGNLHLNVPTRRFDSEVEKALEPFVYELVRERGGSISAEHGLGLQKKPYIGYTRSDNMVRLMKQIKALYDPNGIMNPYKYI